MGEGSDGLIEGRGCGVVSCISEGASDTGKSISSGSSSLIYTPAKIIQGTSYTVFVFNIGGGGGDGGQGQRAR